MLLIKYNLNVIDVVITYLTIYNISLLNMYWILSAIKSKEALTLQTLNKFSFDSFFTFTLTVLLLSMAGVPPLLGFFTKVSILVEIINNGLFLLFFLFFILLIIGLYFYVQNIRFLHSTHKNNFNYPYMGNERVIIMLIYFTLWFMFIQILGPITINYFYFYIMWF